MQDAAFVAAQLIKLPWRFVLLPDLRSFRTRAGAGSQPEPAICSDHLGGSGPTNSFSSRPESTDGQTGSALAPSAAQEVIQTHLRLNEIRTLLQRSALAWDYQQRGKVEHPLRVLDAAKRSCQGMGWSLAVELLEREIAQLEE